MSIFDSIKNALGGGKAEAEPDVTMAPSQVLRQAGIDTRRLDLSFGTNSITVGGEITDEAEREKILDILAGLPGIETIEDSMTVAAPEPEPPAEPQVTQESAPETGPDSEPEPAPADEATAEPESQPASASEAAADAAAGERTYTVKSGDTLWKIAEEVYGSGSRYTDIFEANQDLLENPDRIFPGQVLKIPDLD